MYKTLPSLLTVLAVACGGARAEGELPGDCADGADNDRDGLFDCDDVGCQGSPACDASAAGGGSGSGGSPDGGAAGSACQFDMFSTLEVGGIYGFPSDINSGLGSECADALGLTYADQSFTCEVSQTGCAVTADCNFRGRKVTLGGSIEVVAGTEFRTRGTFAPLSRPYTLEWLAYNHQAHWLAERVNLTFTLANGSSCRDTGTRL